MKQAIIIPTLNPTSALVSLVEDLSQRGAGQIIIVNDGSEKICEPIFEQLKAFEHVTILAHDVNRGKGAALKTAFKYCLKHAAALSGVVTADDDGQHTASDILRVAEALARFPDRLILGVRDFQLSTTPARSYMGNRTISRIIRWLYGIRLADSQTGLRGIPFSALAWMSSLRGEHYEFEIHMLIHAARKSVAFEEIPIQLLYFNENKASHYKTIRDTLRIAGLLAASLFRRPTAYGPLFRFTRFILRRVHRRLSVDHTRREEPAVYIARHRNLKGVFDIILWYDKPVHIWVLDVFYDFRHCYHQYAHYTLTRRMGLPRVLAYPLAFIFALYVPRLMRSMRAIPVYRSSVGQIGLTLEQSVDLLCNNESLLIFPDVEYTNESNRMGEMYAGFVNTDKPYYTYTQKHLPFIPLRVNEETLQIESGSPVYVRNDTPFPAEKKRVCAELHTFINR